MATSAESAKQRVRPRAGSVERGAECPACDALACMHRDGSRHCCWCGAVTARDNEGKWHVVDTCLKYDGSWP